MFWRIACWNDVLIGCSLCPGTQHLTYAEYFTLLTGHAPYAFQEQLGERILRGESLVFRAPTGAGKTWTTVAPFLYSLAQGTRIADRLIYALPLRALASSLHASVLAALQEQGPVATTAKERAYPSEKVYCSLQMGGEKNDPFFEGDLIFCTIDQLLSGYLMMPLSLPDRVGNMVAGALPGSIVVLDEAHLLDNRTALGTMIEMLCRFRNTVQFVIMTATMSDESMEWLARQLGGRVPALPPAEIRQLPVQRSKERRWRRGGDALTAESVRAVHRGGRTLVIVNRVQRAQNIYAELVRSYAGTGVRLACLHSRFFPEDRARTEQALQDWFGRTATQSNVILITTQVVEAGIDISADDILTELAPMNSLVQRAGRTARYVERNKGTVWVFGVDSFLPYHDDLGECSATLVCLAALPAQGQIVDFEQEQKWVEAVHGSVEKRNLAAYRNIDSRRGLVETAIRTGDRGHLSKLVREIDAVNVILTSNPHEVEFKHGKWPRMLSVPSSAVWSLAEAVSSGTGKVWRAREKTDETEPFGFDWIEAKSGNDLRGVWLIAISSGAARYEEDAGLLMGQAGEGREVQYTEAPPLPRYRYWFETWKDHTEKVVGQARRMGLAHASGARKLDSELQLAAGTVAYLAELTAILHDVGKLAEKWQNGAWAFETQQDLKRRSEAIAHTTKGHGQRGPQLPHHAAEGAFATVPFVARTQGHEAAWAVASAVARHHGARTKEVTPYRLIAEAESLLRGFLKEEVKLRDGDAGMEFGEFASDLDALHDFREWWPVYAFLVRLLRLADQAGTAEGVREAELKA